MQRFSSSRSFSLIHDRIVANRTIWLREKIGENLPISNLVFPEGRGFRGHLFRPFKTSQHLFRKRRQLSDSHARGIVNGIDHRERVVRSTVVHPLRPLRMGRSRGLSTYMILKSSGMSVAYGRPHAIRLVCFSRSSKSSLSARPMPCATPPYI